MLHRYGEFVARRARLLLLLSLLLLAGAGVLGASAFGKLRNGGFADPAAESTRAQQVIAEEFQGETNLVLLVTAAGGSVDDQAAQSEGIALTSALAAEPHLTDVVSYFTTGAPALRSEDGSEALVLAHLAGDESQVAERADE